MKKRRLFCMTGMLLVLLAVSCAGPKKEVRTEQSEALRGVGEAYMQEGNFTAALRELLDAEELNPDDPYIHDDLGLVYLAKERHDLAITHFKRALKLNPDYTPARNNLATAYMAMGDWDAAITTLHEVIEDLLYTTPHFALTNLGFAYANKGEYKRAEEYYKEALEVEPKFIIALRGLGRTYIAMKRYDRALATIEKALDITPRFPPLYMDMAEAYAGSRNYQAAIQTYKKIIALFPNSDFAEQARREAGEILLQTGASG